MTTDYDKIRNSMAEDVQEVVNDLDDWIAQNDPVARVIEDFIDEEYDVSSNFDDVGEFHHKFGLPTRDRAGGPPRDLDSKTLMFRKLFLQEELDEFTKGLLENDLEQMADALIDLVYVAMGTAHMLNLPWQQLWDTVQYANMQKQRAASDGSNSKRSSSLDVVKPAGWEGPDIRGVLERNGWKS